MKYLSITVMLFTIGCTPRQHGPKKHDWYQCTLPNGQVVRANWVDTDYRGASWKISTGRIIIEGAGPLTCIGEE